MAKALVGDPSKPSEPWGRGSCLPPCVGGLLLRCPGLPSCSGRIPGAGRVAVWRPGAVGRPLHPIPAPTVLRSAALPPAPRSALPVPLKAASSSPWAPREPGKWGSPRAPGSSQAGVGRAGGGASFGRQPLGKRPPLRGTAVQSTSLSVFQGTACSVVTRPFCGPSVCVGSSGAKGPAREERKDLPGRGPEGWGSRRSRSGMWEDAALSPQRCIS